LVCLLTEASRGCLPRFYLSDRLNEVRTQSVAGRNKIEYYLLNSQLWGELWPVVPQKGLQPVTLSLYSFPTCLLFPIIAFHIPDVLVFYSMPDFESKV